MIITLTKKQTGKEFVNEMEKTIIPFPSWKNCLKKQTT